MMITSYLIITLLNPNDHLINHWILGYSNSTLYCLEKNIYILMMTVETPHGASLPGKDYFYRCIVVKMLFKTR